MLRINLKSDKGKFIIKYGIIRFGIPSGITMALLYELFNNNFNLKLFRFGNVLSLNSFIFISLFIIGGIIWGEMMWRLFNQKKKINSHI